MMERLKIFFSYFGGKWRIAKHYASPKHKIIVEPFAGSAGYSLHYPEYKIHLFDLDPKICGIWEYLIRAKESEIMKLPTTISDLRDMKMCQEAKWLIGFWVNKGNQQPCNIPSAWMRSGTRPNSHWGR